MNFVPKNNGGFTLIELIVVIVILAVLLGFTSSYINATFAVKNKQAARNLAQEIKKTYYLALVQAKTYRLVIDFEQNEYWVEQCMLKQNQLTAPLDPKLDSADQTDAKDTNQRDDQQDDQQDDQAKLYQGYECSQTSVEKISLDDNLVFVAVINPLNEEIFEDDQFWLYFFPHGFNDSYQILIGPEKDIQKEHFVLSLGPFLGKVEIQRAQKDF